MKSDLQRRFERLKKVEARRIQASQLPARKTEVLRPIRSEASRRFRKQIKGILFFLFTCSVAIGLSMIISRTLGVAILKTGELSDLWAPLDERGLGIVVKDGFWKVRGLLLFLIPVCMAGIYLMRSVTRYIIESLPQLMTRKGIKEVLLGVWEQKEKK